MFSCSGRCHFHLCVYQHAQSTQPQPIFQHWRHHHHHFFFFFSAVFPDCGTYSAVLPDLMFNITVQSGICIHIIQLLTSSTDNSCSISFSWKGTPTPPYLMSLLLLKNLHLDHYLSISLAKPPRHLVSSSQQMSMPLVCIISTTFALMYCTNVQLSLTFYIDYQYLFL